MVLYMRKVQKVFARWEGHLGKDVVPAQSRREEGHIRYRLTNKEIQAINEIANVQRARPVQNRSKAPKRRRLKIEQEQVSSHPSRRVAGSGSVITVHRHTYMRLAIECMN